MNSIMQEQCLFMMNKPLGEEPPPPPSLGVVKEAVGLLSSLLMTLFSLYCI